MSLTYSPDELLNAAEIAAWLRISPSTVYRLTKSRQIPFYRVGSQVLFDREEILKCIRRPVETRQAMPGAGGPATESGSLP